MAAGIYLHIPFCRSRCSYCDFATDIYRDAAWVERYVTALVREIDRFRTVEQGVTTNIDTIYFGGGTPSLLSAKQVERIIESINRRFEISGVKEITMEMNPATVTQETLRDYRALGVNRASFGVQTFNDNALKLLARGHDANDARTTFKMLRDAGFDNISFDLIAGLPNQTNDARETFKMLRNAGFDNISFDLIAGLPNQTLNDWKKNLDEAISMSPEHLSLYLLEIHQSTPLAEQVLSGRQPQPDEELAAEMYEMMLDKLAAAGYQQYEISNFSRPGFESRHNTKYWTLDPVFGFGVSAHSFDGTQRYVNERDTAKYVDMIETSDSAIVEKNELSKKQLSSEFAFLSLRLSKGLDLGEYTSRFQVDLKSELASDLLQLQRDGLIFNDGKVLTLTRKGMIYSNEVFVSFV